LFFSFRRSSSRGHSRRSIEKTEPKRRRLSPESIVSHSSGSYSHAITRRLLNMSFLLNSKELLIPDLRYRFPSVLAPVDLYRVVCHWQNSFPLLKPFYPEGSSVYQILDSPKESFESKASDCTTESGYFVNVLLLSMPQMTSLHEKTVVRAENSERTRGSLRKYVQIMASVKGNEGFKAIGGSWKADLDGADPAKDPRTLINTAIRTCKEQLKLDLSSCTQWHRFLEFRYGRTEGSTARPTSVLFPGADLWGRKYPDSGKDTASPSKPFHKIVVYFIPDVWSLVPSSSDWPKMRKAFEILSAQGQNPTFPLTADLQRQTLDDLVRAKAEKSSEKTTGTNGSNETDKGSLDFSSTEANTSCALDQSVIGSPKTSDSSNQAKTKESTNTTTTSTTTPVDAAEKPTLKPHEDLNLQAMKVSELREQLKVRNLPADGIKVQLLNRLKAVIEKEAEEARKAEEEPLSSCEDSEIDLLPGGRLSDLEYSEDIVLLSEAPCKQKEEQEAQAAKELQAKKEEAERQQVAEAAAKQEFKFDTSKANLNLRNYPSLVLQPQMVDCRVQSVTLEDLLEPKVAPKIDAQSFELMFCAHTMLEMLHRDAIFILFRALVTAGDRGVQAKAATRSESRLDSKSERSLDSPEVPVRCTVDVPLLFACTLLDINSRGYFHGYEAEGLIASLGLPVSRYQIRSLVTKVSDDGRIHYRSLTDAEITPTTAKSKITYSEIDDDEYLLELIRGGDAVLEEGVENALPTGSVLVFHTPGTSESESNAVTTSSELTVPSTTEFAQRLRGLEMEKTKLFKQMKTKMDEIARLRTLTDQIPNLRKQLESANSNVTDLRKRLKHEREQMHAANRVVEQQINNLDSARVALRQASNRLRGRAESSSSSKRPMTTGSTTESKTPSGGVRASPKSTNTPAATKSDSQIESVEAQKDSSKSDATETAMETEESVISFNESLASEVTKLAVVVLKPTEEAQTPENEKLLNGVIGKDTVEVTEKSEQSIQENS
uniref:SAP domain-containing protein n=1 Tax=Echinostoma caproni TaxID=27848 RepID=A0A183AK28_9TREM